MEVVRPLAPHHRQMNRSGQLDVSEALREKAMVCQRQFRNSDLVLCPFVSLKALN